MTDFKKWVLMVQPNRMQGLIWQTVLKSQGISVIWESPDADVIDNVNQLSQAGLALPDLLLIDVQLTSGNAYDLCRWCRDRATPINILLTDCSQTELTDYERRWATYQGAINLLPAFQRENLVSQVATAVKRVLEVLDEHPLNNGALVSVLLSMKRQIEDKNITLSLTKSQSNGQAKSQSNGQAKSQSNGQAKSQTNGQETNGKLPPQPEPLPKPKAVDSSAQTQNGHSTNDNHPQPEPPRPSRTSKLSYRFGKPKQ